MKATTRSLIATALMAMLAAGCSGDKKMVKYGEVYRDHPATLYIAPLDDRSERRAVRTMEDSAYNASLDVATRQLYLTASSPLVRKGYYVPGPLTSAQMASTETRTLKQLRNDNITDYYDDLGMEAVLFIEVMEWNNTHNSWTVEVDYKLRSARHGGELMHTRVRATKMLGTDFKGNPKPLADDEAFAKKYGCDLHTAQRCRLVEILNQFVLGDLPSGQRARGNNVERYVSSHPEYFALHITPDGSVMVLKNEEDL